jgi:GT2 family glycosyltransferase
VCDNASRDDSLTRIKAWAEGGLDVVVPPNNPLRRLSFPPVPKPVDYAEYEEGQWQNVAGLDYPPLVLIKMSGNLGFAHANNEGIRLSLSRDADYIWLLNIDTVIDDNALTAMVQLAQSEENTGMVGSKLYYYHQPTVIQALGGSDRVAFSLRDDVFSFKGLGSLIHNFDEDRPDFNRSFPIKGYVHGASLLAKRELIESVGYMDENYFMFKEEIDWCIRSSRKGWQLIYCGESRVWHKEGATGGKHTTKTFWGKKSIRGSLQRFVITGYYDTRNSIYLLRKNFPDRVIYWISYANFYLLWKIFGVILYDDRERFERIRLLVRGYVDALKYKLGKTIDPEDIVP